MALSPECPACDPENPGLDPQRRFAPKHFGECPENQYAALQSRGPLLKPRMFRHDGIFL